MLLNLALVSAYAEDLDCRLSESDYYDLRKELIELRRGEGSSIGVIAEGKQCEMALDTVLRNGPFIGVQRKELSGVESATSDTCTAVLRPAPDGYSLATFGDCRDPAMGGPSRMVSVGWWLPYGVSARWNEELGLGFSAVVDMGWQLPSQNSPFDLSANTAPTGPATTLRPMLGFDLAPREFSGSYLGFRTGFEVPLIMDSDPFDPALGLVSFLAGRKWMANGFALQAGAGGVAEIPMADVGPRFAVVYPTVELRVGFTNRR
jgi:hypothetical protein